MVVAQEPAKASRHCIGFLPASLRDPKAQPVTRARRIDALPDDPSQRLAFVALIVGPHLRMQEHSDRTNQPVLPVMSSNDRYALDPPMVVFFINPA